MLRRGVGRYHVGCIEGGGIEIYGEKSADLSASGEAVARAVYMGITEVEGLGAWSIQKSTPMSIDGARIREPHSLLKLYPRIEAIAGQACMASLAAKSAAKITLQ